MTTDEQRDLHEQAAQLCYQAIVYDHLSREPLCKDDELAEQIAVSVVAHIRRLLNDEWGRIEAAKEVERIAKETMAYE